LRVNACNSPTLSEGRRPSNPEQGVTLFGAIFFVSPLMTKRNHGF
jgi:hypothetical protein